MKIPQQKMKILVLKTDDVVWQVGGLQQAFGCDGWILPSRQRLRGSCSVRTFNTTINQTFEMQRNFIMF